MYRPCVFCKKEISSSARSYCAHMRKHVREGYMEEFKDRSSRYPTRTEFELTQKGKDFLASRD